MAHHNTLPTGEIINAALALVCGTKIVAAAATPERLVAVSTPCRFVLVGARINADTGATVNTKPAFIGGSATAGAQTMVVTVANFEGVPILIDDAHKLFVKVGVNGEGVSYAIFT